MNDVRVYASGRVNSYGVQCHRSWVTMTDVDILVGGNGVNVGLALTSNNDAYRAELSRLRVFANPTVGGNNTGISVQGVPVSVHGALITVGQGAPYSYGILQQDSPTTSLALRHVVVRMTAGSNGFGVFNTNTGGNVALDHSDIQAPTNSVRNDNAAKTFLVGNTRLAGLAWGTVKCVFSYNDAYNPPNSACVP